MKNLFNNISQEEKNMILEMHSGRKNTISEQKVKPKMVPYGSYNSGKLPVDAQLWKTLEDELSGEGPSIRKETPNQLVIDGLSGVWTISFSKFTNEMRSGRKNTISEQKVKPKMVPYGSKPDRLPFDTPLWKTLENEIHGDGPSILKEIPNQLVIDGLSGTWTITLTK